MGRRTDEVKNHIVKCRIGDDLYERIKGENVSDTLRNALENYVTHNNSVPQKNVPQKDNVPQNNVPQNSVPQNSVPQNSVPQLDEDDIKVLDDIGQMAKLSGSDLKSILSSLQFKLTFNDIEIKDGELAVYKSLWDEVSEDEEVEGLIGNLNSLCDERGVGLSEAYKQVLMVGGKIVYANIRDGGMEHG